jgi:hypothetical protein
VRSCLTPPDPPPPRSSTRSDAIPTSASLEAFDHPTLTEKAPAHVPGVKVGTWYDLAFPEIPE